MPSSPERSAGEEATMAKVTHKFWLVVLKLWGRTSRRIKYTVCLVAFLLIFCFLSWNSLPTEYQVPTLKLDYSQNQGPFNESKVALLIENRVNPILAPLMLHFMAVIPPDWRFRFMGSQESVAFLNESMAIRQQVSAGKLDLTYIPSNMTTGSQEEISRFLTTLWLYEVVLQPAEWLLLFQTDSVLCANTDKSLNDFLEYDWVGAPWNPNGRFGGNGGLSLRRVSAIIEILRNQERIDGSEPEDVWLTDRLGHRPGSLLANGTLSLAFSGEMHGGEKEHLMRGGKGQYNGSLEAVEHGEYVKGVDDWREGFYEPMGYHTGGSGKFLHPGVWGSPTKRKHIWQYCPEVKMTLNMDAAKYVPGICGANWKRDQMFSYDIRDIGPPIEFGADPEKNYGWGSEIIDGEEFPLLPPNIVPF
ncbi:hypothetical protein MKZ38_006105 [Zalerion maritima]|uniref:DUF5672 domain-containing protein n=1 Tax=Zalerion maritima TaxID=339359 RepID=A0AAD5WU21_9PEZI|nr:hypothetical protein MKZ38_006105 [Zalerion maritima]